MKNLIISRLLIFLLFSIQFFFNPLIVKQSFAASCLDYGIDFLGGKPKKSYTINESLNFSVTGAGILNGNSYTLIANGWSGSGTAEIGSATGSNNSISFNIPVRNIYDSISPDNRVEVSAMLVINGVGSSGTESCDLHLFFISNDFSCSGNHIFISQERIGRMCGDHSTLAGSCTDKNHPIRVQVSNIKSSDGQPYQGQIRVKIVRTLISTGGVDVNVVNGRTDTLIFPNRSTNQYYVIVEQPQSGRNKCNRQIRVIDDCNETCAEFDIVNPPIVGPEEEEEPFIREFRICDQINRDLFDNAGNNLYEQCLTCVGGEEDGREGIWTAVGCINRAPDQIIATLLRVGLTMAGGVALLVILAASFILSTSQGDPKRTTEAKDMLVAAITGLIFIIFSVTILQFIGYSVLRIPGFGG